MPTFLRRNLLLAVFIHLSTFLLEASGDDEPTVVIDPFRLSMQVGESTSISCSVEGEHNITSIRWFDPDGLDIGLKVNQTSVQYSNNTVGEILIENARAEDSGIYTCMVTLERPPDSDVTDENTEAFQYNQTFWLNIYVMPSYLKEGMIVLGLNLGLGLVFAALVIHTFIVDRERLAKYGKIPD